MNLISALAAALTLCGRHGTLIAAASIFIGLAVPPLDAAFRPHLGEAIVVMLTLAFLRVDPVELRRHWTQPGLIAAAMVWTMLILLAVLGMVFLAFKLDQKMPGLYFMLVLQMSALGLMSSPALAALWSRRRTHHRVALFRGRAVSYLSAPALAEVARQAPLSQSLTSRRICLAAALPVYPPRVRRDGVWRPQCPVR
jgi:BASS family bile acid:Na+ symporter